MRSRNSLRHGGRDRSPERAWRHKIEGNRLLAGTNTVVENLQRNELTARADGTRDRRLHRARVGERHQEGRDRQGHQQVAGVRDPARHPVGLARLDRQRVQRGPREG
jgi:hypothetical protein